MKKDDTCYYMSITKEENSAFVVHQNQNNQTDPQQKEGEKVLMLLGVWAFIIIVFIIILI